MSVLFSTDAAGFNFENDVELGTFLEQAFGDFQVLIEFHDRAVEHVGVEKWAFACGDALARGIEQRAEEGIDFLRVAMVGVQANKDIVFFSEQVSGFGKHDGAESFVGNSGAGCEATATGGNLDDAIGACLGECLECTINGGQGGDVDGGICIATLLGGIEHGGVLFRCCYWHDAERLPCCRTACKM